MSKSRKMNKEAMDPQNISYITSGLRGLGPFTFREIECLIERYSCKIELCLTQLKKGPYMPKEEWNVHVATERKIFLGTLLFMIKHPKKFISLISEARKNKTILYLLLAFEFWRELRKKNLTRIHVQMADHKLFIGYYLHKIFDLKLSCTLHAHELYRRENYDKPGYFSLVWKCCNPLITISNFNKKNLIEKYGIPEDKIKVIRLFAEHKKIEELKKEKVKILITATWIDKKGHKILFDALKRLNRNDIEVWCTGDMGGGPDSAVDLKKLIKDIGVEDKVMLLGRVSDTVLSLLYQNCDIYCLPSVTTYYEDGKVKEREGIPVALMEAMAYSKPVISTKHAGIPELVEDILVEENNVEEVAKAIELLADNPELRKRLGERNRRIIEERYSEKNVLSLRDIFLEGGVKND